MKFHVHILRHIPVILMCFASSSFSYYGIQNKENKERIRIDPPVKYHSIQREEKLIVRKGQSKLQRGAWACVGNEKLSGTEKKKGERVSTTGKCADRAVD